MLLLDPAGEVPCMALGEHEYVCRYECSRPHFSLGFGLRLVRVAEPEAYSRIGTALQSAALCHMRHERVRPRDHWRRVGSTAFYTKTVGAVVIKGSSPGIHTALLTVALDRD